MKKLCIILLVILCFLTSVLVGMTNPELGRDNNTTTSTDNSVLNNIKEVTKDTQEEIKEIKIEIENNIYTMPNNSGFKSYMDYRTITDTSSLQYKLQNTYAHTGDYGIRMVDNRYCIALGTYFTSNIGQYIDLTLENGVVIPCILAEVKADIHTDSNNIMTMHNGCVTEFVVDTNVLFEKAKTTGNISYCQDKWKSPVKKVKVYDENIFN